MRTRVRSAAVGLTILSAWCLASLAPLSGAAGTIELGVGGRRNATPTIAADGAFVTVVWGGARASGATDVFAAVSRDGGRTFGAPVRVNNVEGDARLNGEQPPHVALVRRSGGREPAIVVVWTTKGTNGTTLLQSRSDDAGRSFSTAVLVPGTDAPGNRGWQAIAVDPAGGVDVVWLDHRELADDPAMAASHHGLTPRDGVAMAQKSKVFFASLDGAAAPRAVAGGVCYCCKTALVRAGETVYAAWRHVYPGNLRDIAFTISRDNGRTFAAPIRVSEDQWALEGCPDDGPAMAVDAHGRIHVVWPTLVGGATAAAEPNIALFYAMSADGRHFTPRERIPTEGTPHHPRIAAGPDGSLTLAWDELAGGVRGVAIGRGAADERGRPRFHRELLSTARPGVYPALAVAGDGAVAAWTSGASASIEVRRVTTSSGRVRGTANPASRPASGR